jgi:hypothetical protein
MNEPTESESAARAADAAWDAFVVACDAAAETARASPAAVETAWDAFVVACDADAASRYAAANAHTRAAIRAAAVKNS